MLASIGKIILDWLYEKLAGIVNTLLATLKRQKQVKDESDASLDPLRKAKTKEEIDNAADDALGGF